MKISKCVLLVHSQRWLTDCCPACRRPNWHKGDYIWRGVDVVFVGGHSWTRRVCRVCGAAFIESYARRVIRPWRAE